MKVKTEKLKELVTKAVVGSSNNKLIPITGLICIKVDNGTLTSVTTDATNYLYVSAPVESETFYVVVDASVFSKLVSRITSEFITLEIVDNVLEVSGNGKYKLELPIDENGLFIKYPNPLNNVSKNEVSWTKLDSRTIKVILSSLKPSLATILDEPCYTGYYFGDSIIATDTMQIAEYQKTVFGTPKLLSRELVDLLDVFDSDVSVRIDNDTIIFTDDTNTVCGKLMSGIEDFNIAGISSVLDISMESSCKFSKVDLLNVLNRLMLFVKPYDKNGINLVFTSNGLQVSSKSANSVELISYVESSNFKDYSCMIDIEMFTKQIKSSLADVIEIKFGNDSCISIVDCDVKHIVALLVD